MVRALFVQLPSGQFSTLNITTNLHNFWQEVTKFKCNASTALASHWEIECCSHQLIRRKRKIENWMLQSSTASSRTKKWKINVAVINQFFETRKMNVAVINWFVENERSKIERCSHQLLLREQKKWKMNVAVSNQFFETRKTNVAWFIGNKWSKIERCSHQLIFFWAKNLKLNLAINNHLKPDCMCMQLSIGFWKWEIEYTYITNYCWLSADIELALNVSTYAGQRSPQLAITSQWCH